MPLSKKLHARAINVGTQVARNNFPDIQAGRVTVDTAARLMAAGMFMSSLAFKTVKLMQPIAIKAFYAEYAVLSKTNQEK